MLNISGLSKMLGSQALYSNASLQIYEGEKVGLVGVNGCGKSTLFRMIIGEETPDQGQISFPTKMKLAYFSQNVSEMKGRSAVQEVMAGDFSLYQLSQKIRDWEEKLLNPDLTEDEMNKILEQMGEAQTQFERQGGYELENKAEEILTGLGIMPVDHQKQVENFSGGWRMRIALAKVLITNPDLILMDEPTNYLDMETILWLEKWLKNFKGAVFMITHDRDFMNNIVKKVIEISQGKVTTYNGNYAFYLQEKEVRLTQIKAEFNRQQEMLSKEEEFIAKFKARASHAAQVQSRIKKIDKIERVEVPQEEMSIAFEFPTPPRGGDDVIMIKDLAKTWVDTEGKETPVFKNLTVTVQRLEKIAVVGVNGAGKSTLLKVLCGQTNPTHGQVTIGPSIKLGYFSQYSLDVLKPENTVFEEVRNSLAEVNDGTIRNLLAAFLFRGDDVEKKVRQLSGGEKSRLILATLLAQNNNLLILDEPTNHLDITSREVLLEALKKFEGTILLVSHDRHFLHELSQKVFEVDHGGIHIYPGNYSYYLSKKQTT